MKLKYLSLWKEIYDNNMQLDKIFISKYLDTNPDIYEKNCIEFLVELGEFTNESKCFKYWSIKTPDKNKLLEEYADCITMILTFYSNLNMPITPNINHLDTTNPLLIINYLYQEGTRILKEKSPDIMINLFNNLIYLGTLFNLSELEIINAIKNKQNIILERLNSDY